jgi:hypothetical protein
MCSMMVAMVVFGVPAQILGPCAAYPMGDQV